jgi:type I restriction enzyme M protein
VVKLPSGVFQARTPVSRPRSSSSLDKRSGGTTGDVWFYDVESDGWSLDDKRTPLLSEDKLGPSPRTPLTEPEHAKNNLPDILHRWSAREAAERDRPRTAQSFTVPKSEIAAQGYDLSLNRYKEVIHETTAHRPPKEILASLAQLEKEIQQGMKELEEMLG